MRDSAMIAAATELHVAAYQHFGLENDGLWSSDANDKNIIEISYISAEQVLPVSTDLHWWGRDITALLICSLTLLTYACF